MDIGGVTTEEVNAHPLSKMMDISSSINFGLGSNLQDRKSREGTFYVGYGNTGVLATEPPFEEDDPIG